MNDEALDIKGGASGLAADLDAMAAASRVLADVSHDLARLASRTALLAAEAATSQTVLLDPGGLARAEAEMLPLLVGPFSVATCAARVALLAAGVSAAARGYAAAEAGADAAVAQARAAAAKLVGGVVARSAPVSLPAGTAAGLAVLGAWAGCRAAPLLVDEAERLVHDVTTGQVADAALEQRLATIGETVLLAMRDDATGAATAATTWLAGHPAVAEQTVQASPAFLDGLTGGLMLPAAPTAGVLPGRPGWPPHDVQEVAAVLSAVGAVSPLFVEGRVDVRQVAVAQPPPVPEGRGVAAALERLAPYTGPARPEVPRVRVERVQRATGVSWSVYIPPTQTWRMDGGPNPFDGSTNVRAGAGRRTAAGQAVTQVLRRSGVKAGEPLMLAGYSQGGLTAVQLASDPAFREEFSVTTVLSAGSPVAGFDVPPDVQVLSLEHEQDLIPTLDDGRNPDRPNWTTVRRNLGENAGETALAGHRLEHYLETAQAVDATKDASVAAWQEAARPFLTTTDAQVEVVEWEAWRVEE